MKASILRTTKPIQAVLLVVATFLSLSSFGCREIVNCPNADLEVADEYNCNTVRQEITNTRIALVGQEALKESNSIWLLAGEDLVVKWDSFKNYYTFGGATCDFTSLTHRTDDCSICDFCDTSSAFENLCHISQLIDIDLEKVRLLSYEGFMTEAEPTTVHMQNSSGCSARGFGPYSFTPPGNATYQVLPPPYFSDQSTLTEKKIFIIPDGATQTIPYGLTKYAEEAATQTAWYEWTVPGALVWNDNFSEKLRISKVRILTGTLIQDPISGTSRVENEKVVRPSRIVFLRDFVRFDPGSSTEILNHGDETTQRCYANTNQEDGNISLTMCRPASQSASTVLFDATPTYVKNVGPNQLTWIAEFNLSEGADYDPATAMPDMVPANAALVIEFTIEKVP